MKMIRLVLITGLALLFADDLKPIGASAAPQKILHHSVIAAEQLIAPLAGLHYQA